MDLPLHFLAGYLVGRTTKWWAWLPLGIATHIYIDNLSGARLWEQWPINWFGLTIGPAFKFTPFSLTTNWLDLTSIIWFISLSVILFWVGRKYWVAILISWLCLDFGAPLQWVGIYPAHDLLHKGIVYGVWTQTPWVMLFHTAVIVLFVVAAKKDKVEAKSKPVVISEQDYYRPMEIAIAKDGQVLSLKEIEGE